MPDGSTLLVFALASAALVAVPGPAVLYIVTRAIAQGRSAGLVSALGIEAGALLHVGAAVVGLSALVASSATAFAVVKYVGAAYLIFLGVQRLRQRSATSLDTAPPESNRVLFRRGVFVNAMNPKVAVFFLAFLPQFVEPDGGPVALQVAFLGLLFVVIATTLDFGWALVAGTAGQTLRSSVRVRRRLDTLSGATFISLGAVAAVARR